MTLIQINNNTTPSNDLPLLRLAFRPFFLCAGFAAVALIVFWLYILSRGAPASIYGAIPWHAHEMIFGFTIAVIAGFLLTAEKNWTGLQTLKGPWLGMLALLWLAGRIAPWLPLPLWLIAMIDLAFLPLLALAMIRPIVKTSQYQHLVFIIIVLVLFIANILFHTGYQQPNWHTTNIGIQLAWMSIILLITVMGGRVIPFFIERGTSNIGKTHSYRAVEVAAVISLIAWMLAALFTLDTIYIAWLAAIAGMLQLARLWGWHLTALWRVPMLWILFLGYSWIPVGLFLYAYASITSFGFSSALHAFTAGAMGLLTMGMMSRVALGHTGRDITASTAITLAFVLLSLGSLLRVFGPLLPGIGTGTENHYAMIINVAGGFWIAGFIVFVYVYFPILTRPRIDGQPG